MNQRPLGASYRTRGSEKYEPFGTLKNTARSKVISGDPDLDHTDPLPLTVSRSEVGPAASCVSGGATFCPLPSAVIWLSRLITGKPASTDRADGALVTAAAPAAPPAASTSGMC